LRFALKLQHPTPNPKNIRERISDSIFPHRGFHRAAAVAFFIALRQLHARWSPENLRNIFLS